MVSKRSDKTAKGRRVSSRSRDVQVPRGSGAAGRGYVSPSSYRPSGSYPGSTPRTVSPRSFSYIDGGASRTPQTYSPVKVGAVSQSIRADRVRQTYRSYIIKVCVVFALIAALVIASVCVYYSGLFSIEKVTVSGVEHLTDVEMSALAAVPDDTTLLRVDASGIRNRIMRDAWVQDVDVQRVFPDTLNLAVTERSIGATVAVGIDGGQSEQLWAIAQDGMWLCPIPDKDSEAGKATSPKIFEDADAAFKITDVSYGVVPEVGSYCSDDSINNAMQVVTGLTTELKDKVVKVSATSPETTTLTLDSGVEIAFGKAEDIRNKERICLEIMKQHPDKVAYINVRVASSPTWRAL